MKERKILFTAHSKLITRCLPFLLFLFLFYTFDFDVFASQSSYTLDDLNLSSREVFTTYSTNYSVSPYDGVVSYYGNTYNTVQYYKHDDFVLNFRFFNDSNVFKFPVTNLDYNFQLNVPSNFNLTSAEFFLIHDGVEYPLYNVNANVGGFLHKLFINGTNTYFDIKAVVKGIHHFSQDISINDFNSNKSRLVSQSKNFSCTVNIFTQYESSDYLLLMDNKINQILNEEEGIKGAINDQTFNYSGSSMGSAESDFNAGAGELTGIEDTLSDSSTQYVDTFTAEGFDASLLDSLAPSMQYLVTWFTNFWNIGGALTKCFTLCFALFIAFYILRVRS